MEYIINDIKKALDRNSKVYIEYGSLNDRITGYSVNRNTIIFNTMNSTSYFGSKVDLTVFEMVDYIEDDNTMIVRVCP